MARILVAGVGNIFFGDDGFGNAVIHALAGAPLGPDVLTRDFGISGLHLAYELLETRELAVIADTMPVRTGPGTICVIEPDLDEDVAFLGTHGLQLPEVFAQAKQLGGELPRILIVGCEAENVADGIGLSQPVRDAVANAAAMIRELVAAPRGARAHADHTSEAGSSRTV
jgi:hydrogenase maturation protease